MQVERELQSSSLSTCILDGHLQRVTILDAVLVQFDLLMMSTMLLETYDMIYLSTAIGLTPGGSSTVRIYTHTIHRTTQIQTIHRTTQITTNLEECGPCPMFANFTTAFALQPRKKHGKTSVMVIEECQSVYILTRRDCDKRIIK
jgi:hypothetical protein